MTAIPMPARFDMGRVLNRLFAVLGRNLVTFLLLSLLLVGGPTVLFGLTNLVTAPATTFQPATIAIGLAALLVTVSANTVLQGAVIHGTVSDLAGKRASFGDCLSTGLRFILPLIGLGIVSSIGVGLATLLLIVPGVILALAWSVAAPATVVERTGVFGGLDRSIVLTRNHRGSIFLLAIIYLVIAFVVQMVGAAVSFPAMAAGAEAKNFVVISSITNALVQTLTSMVSSAGVASIYYELREIKDGIGAQQLAAVFD